MHYICVCVSFVYFFWRYWSLSHITCGQSSAATVCKTFLPITSRWWDCRLLRKAVRDVLQCARRWGLNPSRVQPWSKSSDESLRSDACNLISHQHVHQSFRQVLDKSALNEPVYSLTLLHMIIRISANARTAYEYKKSLTAWSRRRHGLNATARSCVIWSAARVWCRIPFHLNDVTWRAAIGWIVRRQRKLFTSSSISWNQISCIYPLQNYLEYTGVTLI